MHDDRFKMDPDKFKTTDEIYCHSCGSKISKDANFCPRCSAKINLGSSETASSYNTNESYSKSVSDEWLLVLLLACFLGTFGVHRFYVGKIGTGILMLLTGGGCGIWTIYDIIIITIGQFSNSNGKNISRNT
jgi:TM2 domain-containing membrane protein YozV/DNA-directed RNA polymerase subunit RPC12/RpoP